MKGAEREPYEVVTGNRPEWVSKIGPVRELPTSSKGGK